MSLEIFLNYLTFEPGFPIENRTPIYFGYTRALFRRETSESGGPVRGRCRTAIAPPVGRCAGLLGILRRPGPSTFTHRTPRRSRSDGDRHYIPPKISRFGQNIPHSEGTGAGFFGGKIDGRTASNRRLFCSRYRGDFARTSPKMGSISGDRTGAGNLKIIDKYLHGRPVMRSSSQFAG